jgi:hypothetical protein
MAMQGQSGHAAGRGKQGKTGFRKCGATGTRNTEEAHWKKKRYIYMYIYIYIYSGLENRE